MGTRRFVALFDGLGPDTATARAIQPDTWHWTSQHELLATLAELVDQGNRYFLLANSKEGTTQPRPIQITRPGKGAQREKGSTLAEVQSMMKGKP